jgi:hypothetical protein
MRPGDEVIVDGHRHGTLVWDWRRGVASRIWKGRATDARW